MPNAACSVVVCTWNPRADYFARTLDSLRRQTLGGNEWELVIVDNASKKNLSESCDLQWHPQGRIIREERLGLTNARLRGIEETSGDLITFVDDDNVLADDYLTVALSIARDHPRLGVFGASIKGEFETPPPEWLHPYIEGYAVQEIDRDYWCNFASWTTATPYGAGMCVRRIVAEDYTRKVSANPLRRGLDRKGVGLGSGGDTDLAWCAVDLGLGTGRFTALRLTHLISQDRMTERYVTGIYAGFAGSNEILASFRKRWNRPPRQTWKDRYHFWKHYLRCTKIQRKMLLATREARLAAIEILRRHYGT